MVVVSVCPLHVVCLMKVCLLMTSSLEMVVLQLCIDC